ncbi:hypothetical protein [Spirosoma rhododendri]|uniref:Uncharacterized protein n=1 Tax=Spirosoma rhododendri TaxID=2728024 RepID=A0A7L5DP11_9BACT|nr:hypothetical protein [Spirosoma rhododendri]QJD80224.1 hypothetical protein HH216_18725 [Spirosoma rhododendri]
MAMRTMMHQLVAALLTLIVWGWSGSDGRAQAGLKMTTADMNNAVNKNVTADGFGQKTQSMALGGQAISSQPGKYGVMFLNAPIYKVYVERLEDNVDVMLSTLNDTYPLRKELIDQLIGIAGGLTYEYHLAVGTQTGQPKSMSPEAREKFMKSITESFTVGFYTDYFMSLNDDYRVLYFSSDLQRAATASGEPTIAQYNPNTMYMASAGSDPSRGKDRIRDTAKDCVAYVLSKIKQTETLGTTGKPSGGAGPNSDQVSKLFNQFNQIKGGYYWKQTKPGSSIAFYLKQLPGATLASDVVSEDGTGDRYVDRFAIDNGLLPFPSPSLLNMATNIGNGFSGIGLVTVPDPSKIVITPTNSSGNDSSKDKKNNDPPVIIH